MKIKYVVSLGRFNKQNLFAFVEFVLSSTFAALFCSLPIEIRNEKSTELQYIHI